MMQFEKLTENIYRLKVPFYDIYTAVFALRDADRWMVFDSGNSDADAHSVILPALQKAGIFPAVLVISHHHGDHAGGINALSEMFPDAVIKAADPLRYNRFKCKVNKLYGREMLGERFQGLYLSGHCEDMVGLYDVKEGILLTADALQCYGVSRWGTGISSPDAYLQTIAKIRELHPRRIIASHDYFPLGAEAEGENVDRYLQTCEEIVAELTAFVCQRKENSDQEIAAMYNQRYPHRPTLAAATVGSIRKERIKE